MKSLVSSLAVGLLLCTPLAGSMPLEASQKSKKHSKHASVHADDRHASAELHVVFTSREVGIIRQHYAPRYRRLPPGLQKKYARTGQLPPGWQKKMEPFPVEVERELVVLPSGYRRGVLDGHAVIYNPRTQVIIDVAVLF
jgi:hypothetical protein